MADKARRGKTPDPLAAMGDPSVPGPSPNPRTNLILADVALRSVGTLARRGIERKLLAGYGKKAARDIIKGRTLGQTLTAAIVSRIASKSVPGALLIGAGLIGKTLLDRRRKRVAAKREGEAELAKMADNANSRPRS